VTGKAFFPATAEFFVWQPTAKNDKKKYIFQLYETTKWNYSTQRHGVTKIPF